MQQHQILRILTNQHKDKLVKQKNCLTQAIPFKFLTQLSSRSWRQAASTKNIWPSSSITKRLRPMNLTVELRCWAVMMIWIQHRTESCLKWDSSYRDRPRSMCIRMMKEPAMSTNSNSREFKSTMIGGSQASRITMSQESNLLIIMQPTQWMTRCTETLRSCAKETMTSVYSPTIHTICTHKSKNPNQRREQTQPHKRDIQKLQQAVQSQFQHQLTNKDLRQQIPCLKGQLCIQLRGKKINMYRAWRRIRNKLWPTCRRKCRVCKSWPLRLLREHPRQPRNSSIREQMFWRWSLQLDSILTNISISKHILKICQTWRVRCKIRRPNASNWVRELTFLRRKLSRGFVKYRSIRRG